MVRGTGSRVPNGVLSDMRMLMVGMSDLFVILYLTSLASPNSSNSNVNNVSGITLNEYEVLQESEAVLRKEREDAKKELEKISKELEAKQKEAASLSLVISKRDKESDETVRVSQQRLADLEKTKLEAEKREKEATEARREKELAIKAKEDKEKEAAELANKVILYEEQIAKSKINLDSLHGEVAKKEKQIQEVQTARVQTSEELSRTQKEAKDLQGELAIIKQEKENLSAKAQQANEMAAQALANAEQAKKQEQDAILVARIAEMAKRGAEQQAKEAIGVAQDAKQIALLKEQQAKVAQRQKVAVEEKIGKIVQPAQYAYQKNVSSKLVPITIESKTKNLLFGKSKEKEIRNVLPVQVGVEVMAFLPLAQTGALYEDYEWIDKYKVTLFGQEVEKIYVSPNEPYIVAFAVLANISTVDVSTKMLPLKEPIMPTLIAVRNKSDLNVSDKLRDVSGDYFVFSRDRLIKKFDNVFEFGAEGVRGTGDFAQEIIDGDQIVDLDGRFIGVVPERNTVRTILGVGAWTNLSLRKEDMSQTCEFFKQLRR